MATATVQNHGTNAAMSEKEGKYLTFALAHEEYGLEIGKVGESMKILLDIDRVLGDGGSGLLAHEQADKTNATLSEHTTEPSERTT